MKYLYLEEFIFCLFKLEFGQNFHGKGDIAINHSLFSIFFNKGSYSLRFFQSLELPLCLFKNVKGYSHI